MQPIFGNIIWVSNSIYRPKFNCCIQFYLLYIRIYVYTVIVTRRRCDDRRFVLFFYFTRTYVRIFFMFCFFYFQSNEFTGSSGQTYDSKNLLCFCISTLTKYNLSLSFYNLKKKKKTVRNRVLRDRVLAGFTLR